MSQSDRTRKAAATESPERGKRPRIETPQPTTSSNENPVPAAPRSALQRCFTDVISLILAMLCTTDLCAAIRVCKQWHAAAALDTAWPSCEPKTLLPPDQSNEWDGVSAHTTRSIAIGFQLIYDQAITTDNSIVPIRRVSTSPIWNRVRHAIVRIDAWHRNALEARRHHKAIQQSMAWLPRLSKLSALHLHLSNWDALESIEAIWTTLHDRLEAFVLTLQAPFINDENESHIQHDMSHVRMCTRLRALSLPMVPTGATIAALHQLEFIHVSSSNCTATIAPFLDATLLLSTEHCLRTVRLDGTHMLDDNPIGSWLSTVVAAAAASPTIQRKVSALTTFVVHGWNPTCANLDHLAVCFPALTSLTCESIRYDATKHPQFTRLSGQLTSLHATFAHGPSLSPDAFGLHLQHLTLPRVTMSQMLIDGSRLRQLRALESLQIAGPIDRDTLSVLADALSMLPLFRRLHVCFQWNEWAIRHHTLTTSQTIRAIARSPSWTVLDVLVFTNTVGELCTWKIEDEQAMLPRGEEMPHSMLKRFRMRVSISRGMSTERPEGISYSLDEGNEGPAGPLNEGPAGPLNEGPAGPSYSLRWKRQ
jgi:hypothetical protein